MYLIHFFPSFITTKPLYCFTSESPNLTISLNFLPSSLVTVPLSLVSLLLSLTCNPYSTCQPLETFGKINLVMTLPCLKRRAPH